MTVTVQVMVTSSPAVATISDWSRVTLGGGRSGARGRGETRVGYYRKRTIEHLPIHVTPSPVYPWLQVQVKPPGVLVQAALVLHLLSAGEAHSSKSSSTHDS